MDDEKNVLKDITIFEEMTCESGSFPTKIGILFSVPVKELDQSIVLQNIAELVAEFYATCDRAKGARIHVASSVLNPYVLVVFVVPGCFLSVVNGRDEIVH